MKWMSVVVVTALLVQIIGLPSTARADDISKGEALTVAAVYLGLTIGGFTAAVRAKSGGRSGPLKTWLIAGGATFASAFLLLEDHGDKVRTSLLLSCWKAGRQMAAGLVKGSDPTRDDGDIVRSI